MADDLFAALNALRGDPMLQEVLSGTTDDDRRLGARSESPSAKLVASQSPRRHQDPDRLDTDELKFLRERQQARETLGTPHWLSRHRDELTRSDHKRLDARLRAERLFANAQLEYEGFQAEKKERTGSPDHSHVPSPKWMDHLPPEAEPSEIAAAARDAGVSVEAARESFRFPDPDTDADFADSEPLATHGPVNAEQNYREKQSQLGSVTSPRAIGTSPAPIAAASVVDTQAELLEAIRSRDASIDRLQKELNEARRDHADQLQRVQGDGQHQLDAANQRVALLRAQVTELLAEQSRLQTTAAEEAQRSVNEAHACFVEHAETVRAEMRALLGTYERAVECRLQELAESAQLTVSAARDAFTVEKADVIMHEKDMLLQRLTREQDLMLREAEVSLVEALEQQITDKVKLEVKRYTVEQADSLLLPKLEAALGSDVQSLFRSNVQPLVEKEIDKQGRELHSQLQAALAYSAEQLQALSASLAAATISQSAEIVDRDELNKQLAVFKELQTEADEAARRYREREEAHREQQQEMRDRISALEGDVEAERKVAKTLAEELLRLRRARSVLS